jgi:MFS family permease
MTSTSPASAGSTSPSSPMPVSYRRYALGLLVAIYTVNFLDRQIVTILIPDIKRDLNLSDSEVGAMAGLWFAILYTTLGIPIARYADRGDRPWIMTISLAVWSGFTVIAGLAQNFLMLAIARAGVGVGEAGCTPTAHSLLTDYFPKESRARALAIYSMGISIGSLLGMGLGGIIAANWGWRTAFFVAGAPGLILAVMSAFSLLEPRRASKLIAAEAAARAAAAIPTKVALKVLSRKPTFWFFALGAAFAATVSYSHSFFLAGYFTYTQPQGLADAAAFYGIGGNNAGTSYLGLGLGFAAGIGGVIGSWLGGWWCDKYGAKDLRQFVTLPLIFPFIGLPVFWYVAQMDDMVLAMILMIIPNIGVAIWYGPVYGGVPGLVPPAMRATAAAILLFVINIIGLGAGPTLFGMVSDAFANWHLAQTGTGLDVTTCKSIAQDAPQFATCFTNQIEGLRNTVYWSTAIHIFSWISFALVILTIRKDMES